MLSVFVSRETWGLVTQASCAVLQTGWSVYGGLPGAKFLTYSDERIERFTSEKVKREAAQRRPAQSERKKRAFPVRRQVVWFEMQSISN